MEFILTFLLFIFIFGWLVSRLFPLILTWYLKKKMKNGGAWVQDEEVKRSREQEGKVTVTTVEQKEKVIEKDMGEYIDFEEEK